MRVFLLFITLVSVTLSAQNFNREEGVGIDFYTQESSSELVQWINEFNSEIETLLKLRSDRDRSIYIFKDLDSYREHLKELGIESREDFIYIEYSNSSENKLLIYKGYSRWESSLKYHLALQYLKEYGASAPGWYKTALAHYFVYKDLDRDVSPRGDWEQFLYLLNSNSRVLWDSLSYLRWENSTPDYIETLFKNEAIQDKSKKYIQTLFSYKELIEAIKNEYQNKKYSKVVSDSNSLIESYPDRYSSYYYKGLALSKLGEYKSAYSTLSKALDKGAPREIVYYSIGINFYLAKDFKQSKNYLLRITPESNLYEKSQKLLNEME